MSDKIDQSYIIVASDYHKVTRVRVDGASHALDGEVMLDELGVDEHPRICVGLPAMLRIVRVLPESWQQDILQMLQERLQQQDAAQKEDA